MRAGEAYHSLRVPAGCWVVVRVDGRCFTTLTNAHYARPFDDRFHDSMVRTAKELVRDLGAIFATTHSDEISLLLPRDWQMFDREVEKTVSVAAGIASAHFSAAADHIGGFDGRVWVGATDQQVVDYYRWRQADATRGALNSWAYWTLRDKMGYNARTASAHLEHQGVNFKNDLLFGQGINFNEVPDWQRRGAALFWETYEKEGMNPLTQQAVQVMRRHIAVMCPPMGEAFDTLVRSFLHDNEAAAEASA